MKQEKVEVCWPLICAPKSASPGSTSKPLHYISVGVNASIESRFNIFNVHDKALLILKDYKILVSEENIIDTS